ncbi:hypothetical protein GGI24_000877 [Coemansia furcata]|nr:hypothetical protein GGI24_000877 [Coemansia furcata]
MDQVVPTPVKPPVSLLIFYHSGESHCNCLSFEADTRAMLSEYLNDITKAAVNAKKFILPQASQFIFSTGNWEKAKDIDIHATSYVHHKGMAYVVLYFRFKNGQKPEWGFGRGFPAGFKTWFRLRSENGVVCEMQGGTEIEGLDEIVEGLRGAATKDVVVGPNAGKRTGMAKAALGLEDNCD